MSLEEGDDLVFLVGLGVHLHNLVQPVGGQSIEVGFAFLNIEVEL